ncbi:hypothetical protein [Sulfolobus acidocaldarius]|uniref:Uncharacterized protein n=3 Tax=Sulfolobus acidocaldarius TaxID=2285 RepID=A0A0U3GNM5_9CREN|nr:hypothetical protein [Sulfolobus acidocaldarius]AGE71412.1 hypothetical protein SacN8_07240 [Sulfolobus acidocaldarius N8]AGE73684.1 hypothetical protein SacRon12I_07245 [Sulfolobus acidocaldarius Ron12/I]ALU30345.1 hypothetical protein ATY89_10590 [Sulfolobus acidocaldarius]ALU31063.1 hypothetical protein ATZ20_02145 [Sulfolobus acidocaldarius]WCM35322.1 hypothetical protein GO597_08300 [Sulfolobus acidocaldarius DSM 639]
MRIKIAYSRDEEIKILQPVLNNEVDTKGFSFDILKLKEDDLKFHVDEYELLYLPLPLVTFIENLKVLTNGAYVVNDIGIRYRKKTESKLKILVPGSNSTEYYLARMIYGHNVVPTTSQEEWTAELTYDGTSEYSFKDFWNSNCGNLPFVIKLLGSKILDEESLSRIKIVIRDSANLAYERGYVNSFSKELGLKGREALDCFFKICRQKNLCGKFTSYLL